jgi:hypothetical protein
MLLCGLGLAFGSLFFSPQPLYVFSSIALCLAVSLESVRLMMVLLCCPLFELMLKAVSLSEVRKDIFV